MAFLEIVVMPRLEQMYALYIMPVYWTYAREGSLRARECVGPGMSWRYHGDWLMWVEGWVNQYCPGCVIPFAIRDYLISGVSSRDFKLDLDNFMLASDQFKHGGLMAMVAGTARNFLRDQCRDVAAGFQLGEITYRNWGRVISYTRGMQGKTEHILEAERTERRREATAAAVLGGLAAGRGGRTRGRGGARGRGRGRGRTGRHIIPETEEEGEAEEAGAGPSGTAEDVPVYDPTEGHEEFDPELARLAEEEMREWAELYGEEGLGGRGGASGSGVPQEPPARRGREEEQHEGAMEEATYSQGRKVKRSKRIR